MIFTFAGAQNYEVSLAEVNSRLENTGKHFIFRFHWVTFCKVVKFCTTESYSSTELC